MRWRDISRLIPGRTETSCRLRYQNYVEKDTDWSEEQKDKLARLYERYVFLLSITFPLSPFSFAPQFSPTPSRKTEMLTRNKD